MRINTELSSLVEAYKKEITPYKYFTRTLVHYRVIVINNIYFFKL